MEEEKNLVKNMIKARRQRTRGLKRQQEKESDPFPPLGQRDINKSFVAHRDSFISKYVSEQMKINFTNMKEVFVNPDQGIKTSSILFTCIIIWEKFPKYSCYGRVAQYFSDQLQTWILKKWECIFETWMIFLFLKFQDTKISLTFTQVSGIGR